MKLIMYLSFVLFCCCTNTNNRKDSKEDFYTRTSGWDYMRIPLIKPFEVTKGGKTKCVNTMFGWT